MRSRPHRLRAPPRTPDLLRCSARGIARRAGLRRVCAAPSGAGRASRAGGRTGGGRAGDRGAWRSGGRALRTRWRQELLLVRVAPLTDRLSGGLRRGAGTRRSDRAGGGKRRDLHDFLSYCRRQDWAVAWYQATRRRVSSSAARDCTPTRSAKRRWWISAVHVAGQMGERVRHAVSRADAAALSVRSGTARRSPGMSSLA